MGYLATYMGIPTKRRPRTAAEWVEYIPPTVYDVMKMHGVKMCPSFVGYYKEQINAGTNAFEAGAGGYGYNALYVGASYGRWQGIDDPRADSTPATVGKFRTPQETVLFADCAFLMGAPRGVIE